MVRTSKTNYSTNNKKNKSSIGIAQNKRGFLKIHSLGGEDLSHLSILNALDYKMLIPSKEVVNYIILDRVKHQRKGIVELRDVVNVIQIEGINKSGYKVEELEKVVETSKLVRGISNYVKEKAKDEVEYGQFNLVFEGLKTNLLNLDFENAYLFTKLPLRYCENEIWKNPERQLMNFYKETYSMLKSIKEKITRLKNLEKHLI